MGSSGGNAREVRKVLVVGAGVAGLSAGLALAKAGYAVEVLERKPYVGGRASSYRHPALDEVVDCQHVLLGCCTNLIHLYGASGAAGKIRWYDELIFLEPGGRASRIAPSSLPAPFHSMLSFLRASMLGLRDKARIARGLLEFMGGLPADGPESVAGWLRRTGQTQRAVRHFWGPVLEGALNDSFENCSMRYAAQVFRESFLKSAGGGRLGIPSVALGELYGSASDAVVAFGGAMQLRCGVEALAPCEVGGWTARTSIGEIEADAVVLALPFEQTGKLIAGLPEVEGSAELAREFGRFVHSPITTVQLWFDREITAMHHAVLLDTAIQWMFNKTRIRGGAAGAPSYLELTISVSKAQLGMGRGEILEDAMRELALFFPQVKQAKLLKSAVLKEARATFSVLPGLDAARPRAESPWKGIYLAGDWTATGWPSTMEGAARSGLLAAEAVARDAGRPQRFVQEDLPATGLMRMFEKR